MKKLLAVSLFIFATCAGAQNSIIYKDDKVIVVPSIRGPILLSTEGTYTNRDGWVAYCGKDRKEFYKWHRTHDEASQCEEYWKSINLR